MTEAKREITFQPGKQEMFLSSSADIAVYGGSAGGGKSTALLLEPLHYVDRYRGYSACIFRRNTTNIRNPGALWDQSKEFYTGVGDAQSSGQVLEWTWPATNAKVKFAHLQFDDSVYDWHGSQITLLAFDELCEFSSFQFWYMLSRNRSACGVNPYVRATCNPDADSWVAKFIEWWIDPVSGFPIEERCGKLRYFIRMGDDLKWADSPDDLQPEKLGLPKYNKKGEEIEYRPKSVTFISASIYDNPALLKNDPHYLANLLAQPTVERERLLHGNWKIRPSRGLYFSRSWCEVIDVPPPGMLIKRGWDLAATPERTGTDPDWTASVKMGKTAENGFVVLDNARMRGTPSDVERFMRNIASQDGKEVEQCVPQDPGQAGVAQKLYLARALAGVPIRFSTESRMQQNIAWQHHPKIGRFSPFSAQAQAGNVKILRGPWNDNFFAQLETFPEGGHDDDVDATSRAFNSFMDGTTGLLEYYQNLAAKQIKEKALKDNPPDVTVKNGGVRMKGPSGVNVLYSQAGKPIFPDDDGYFVVDPKHAQVLQRGRSGFTAVADQQ